MLFRGFDGCSVPSTGLCAVFTPLLSSILESLKAGGTAELISGTIILTMEALPTPAMVTH